LTVRNGLKLPKNTVAVMLKAPKVISEYLFFLEIKIKRKLALYIIKTKR
jgi:hypothetical protein